MRCFALGFGEWAEFSFITSLKNSLHLTPSLSHPCNQNEYTDCTVFQEEAVINFILPALNSFVHCRECSAYCGREEFGSLVTGHAPSSDLQSLLVCCELVGPEQLQGRSLHPQAVPSKCFSNFTDILSRLSSICFPLLYGNW